jgi:AraC-like DNA-binding protein
MEILNSIYIQYIYFGPLFVIVLALSKLISKERLRINYIYSLSYFVMALAMLQVISYSTKSYPGYYYVSHFLIPFTLINPIMIYIRFRFLIQGKTMRVSPAIIISLVAVIIFLAAGPVFSGRVHFIKEFIELRPLLDPTFTSLPLYFKIVHGINFLSKIILSAGLLTLLLKTIYLWEEIETERMMLARIAYISTIMMFMTSVLGVIGDIVNFEFCKAAVATVNTVTLGVFFASQYDPGYYAIFKHIRQRKKYAASKIQGIDVESVIADLKKLMEEQHLYREENLSLKSVAGMLNINHQQLSEIINRDLNKSFSTYVNDLKITEAADLLAKEPDFTVLRIALMAGFNSVRTFNRAFFRKTGVTPMEYKKKIHQRKT